MSGVVRGIYSDIQISATGDTDYRIVDKVLPYNSNKMPVEYSSAYLSGFGAQRYSVDASEGFNDAKKKIEDDIDQKARDDILNSGYDYADIDDIQIEYYNTKNQHLLFPAWLSAFSFSGKRYMYAINGENGKVGGKRPWSVPKILATVLIVIAIIVLIFTFVSESDAAGFDTNSINNSTSEITHLAAQKIKLEDDVYGVVWTG